MRVQEEASNQIPYPSVRGFVEEDAGEENPASGLAPWTYRLLCLAPVGWAVLFSTFVVRARLALGRWPYAYHPDPKALGFEIHDAALLLGMSLLFAAPFGLLAQLLLGRRQPNLLPQHPWLWLAWFAATFAGFLIVARLDPGGFMNWYAD